MKKIFIILSAALLIFPPLCSFASEEASDNSASRIFSRGFSGQKQVTDAEFKKTVEKLKERSLSKKQKKIKKEVQPLSPAYDFNHLKNLADDENSGGGLSMTMTVSLPVKAYNADGKYIMPGYYKLSCRKINDDEYVLELSEGASKVMEVPAYKTQEDLNQKTVRFCSAEVLSDGRIRLMYGNIDLNLAGYLYYAESTRTHYPAALERIRS